MSIQLHSEKINKVSGSLEELTKVQLSVKVRNACVCVCVCQQGVVDRLVVLQRLVAELELDQKRLNQKNSHLENQKEKLKRDRNILRDTLRQVYAQTDRHIHTHTVTDIYTHCFCVFQVEEERSRFRQQLMDGSRSQVTHRHAHG